jgi:hypothetical protein
MTPKTTLKAIVAGTLTGLSIGILVCVVTRPDYEPDEPLVIIEPNDIAIGADAFAFIDQNDYFLAVNEFLPTNILFCIGQEEYATFRTEGNKVICNVTKEEFMAGLPECIYHCLKWEEPNKPVEIQWAEPNEPIVFVSGKDMPEPLVCFDVTSYCIAIGIKAGYDWTDEDHQFAFTIRNSDGTYTEYSTEMTHDEYKNVHNVVNRAAKNIRILR